jgi:dihydrofolate reductase
MNLIVAHSLNRVIGSDGGIPWTVPEDLKFFSTMTQNSIIIMGRKTFESLPNGPLKNRVNIVITKNVIDNDKVIFANMDNVFNIIEEQQKICKRKVFVIGGSDIYKLFFNYCDMVYVTLIHMEINGDIKFPYDMNEFVKNGIFKIGFKGDVLRSKKDVDYQFFTFEKI